MTALQFEQIAKEKGLHFGKVRYAKAFDSARFDGELGDFQWLESCDDRKWLWVASTRALLFAQEFGIDIEVMPHIVIAYFVS